MCVQDTKIETFFYIINDESSPNYGELSFDVFKLEFYQL